MRGPKQTPNIEVSKPEVVTPKSNHFTIKDPMPNLSGNTWYVATTGNDTNNCATTTTPCATINGAIDKAANDDLIYVSEGQYQGNIAIVSITKSISILGGWNSVFSLQTGFSILDGTGATPGALVQISQNTTIERFIIRNSTGGIHIANGYPCPVGVSVTLRQISITNTGGPNI